MLQIRKCKGEMKMRKQLITDTIKQGGYIHMSEYNAPTLYDASGHAVHRVPVATLERIANMDGMTKWHEHSAVYVARSNGGKYRDYENARYCKHVARELEEYADGNIYKCPECRSTHTITSDKYRCPQCGCVADLDEYDQQSLYDYLSENGLDIEYRIGADKEYRSCEIMVAWGGPNIYIDTARDAVLLYWSNERAQWHVRGDVSDMIDDVCEEQYDAL